jgi:AbrB family looped-hinge helix DNA binding protein
MKQKIIKIGNSVGVTLPYEIREELDLKLGDSVSVDYMPGGQSIIISKKGES